MGNEGNGGWRRKVLLHCGIHLDLILVGSCVSCSCNAGYLLRIYPSLCSNRLLSHPQLICWVDEHTLSRLTCCTSGWLLLTDKLGGSGRRGGSERLRSWSRLSKIMMSVPVFLPVQPGWCSSHVEVVHLSCKSVDTILTSLLMGVLLLGLWTAGAVLLVARRTWSYRRARRLLLVPRITVLLGALVGVCLAGATGIVCAVVSHGGGGG